MTTVAVVGGGRMADAYANTLRGSGVAVAQPDGHLPALVISAFFSGRETLAFLDTTQFTANGIFIDLATQAVDDALRCEAVVNAKGLDYFAGGVTGGAQQVGTSQFVMLLGGAQTRRTAPCLDHLGAIIRFADVAAAVRAKLLHNLLLIVSNQLLGGVVGLAEAYGVDNLLEVLERGTAGRKFSEASVIRDRNGPAVSSYSSDLVVKDLHAIAISFPQSQDMLGIELDELARAHRANPGRPFTEVAQKPFVVRNSNEAR